MGHKKGFTLIEVVVAIAIMLIIGGVVAVAVISGIEKAEGQSDTIDEKTEDYDQSKDDVEGWLGTPIT